MAAWSPFPPKPFTVSVQTLKTPTPSPVSTPPKADPPTIPIAELPDEEVHVLPGVLERAVAALVVAADGGEQVALGGIGPRLR